MIGSFLNAVIYRLPNNVSMKRTRSHCPSCDKLIFWYENIPILSYLFLRGKCSGCKTRISIQYPIVELISGIAGLLLMPKTFSYMNLFFFVFYFSVFECFLALFIIDLKHKILPNSINIYLAILLLIFGLIRFPVTHVIFGGGIGLLFPLGFTYLFYLIKGKVGLGGGDIKLWGALGLYLGIKGIVINIFFSCFLGSIIGVSYIVIKKMDKSQAIPFGPFIIIVSFVQIFFPSYFNEITRLVVGF